MLTVPVVRRGAQNHPQSSQNIFSYSRVQSSDGPYVAQRLLKALLSFVSDEPHLPHLSPPPLHSLPGGNQRDQAREKAQKKAAAADKGKNKESGMSVTQRKERDAQIMREKQAVSLVGVQ